MVLDEPSLGLAVRLISKSFQLIAGLRDHGTAVLLHEQNAPLSPAIADRGHVIENGRLTISGSGRDFLRSSNIAARYLG
jgi:branched-chain amino acid transport system ATP-binding protein